jgi:hypothetical protein
VGEVEVEVELAIGGESHAIAVAAIGWLTGLCLEPSFDLNSRRNCWKLSMCDIESPPLLSATSGDLGTVPRSWPHFGQMSCFGTTLLHLEQRTFSTMVSVAMQLVTPEVIQS